MHAENESFCRYNSSLQGVVSCCSGLCCRVQLNCEHLSANAAIECRHVSRHKLWWQFTRNNMNVYNLLGRRDTESGPYAGQKQTKKAYQLQKLLISVNF